MPPGQNPEKVIDMRKVYAVWADESTNFDSIPHTETLNPAIYWVDNQALISTITFEGNDLKQDDQLKVKVQGSAEGNALIVVKDSDGTIRYSWHLWIANYDPESPNYQHSYPDGYIYMSRNLGATRDWNNNESIEFHGFHYQWGRKDPFPGPRRTSLQNSTSTAIRPVYMDRGNVFEERGIIESSSITQVYNTGETIKNPYKAYSRPNSNAQSVFSVDNTVAYDEFWNATTNNLKGMFDPCPEGWRVPEYSQLPWLRAGNGYTFNEQNSGMVITHTSTGRKDFYPRPGIRSGGGAAVSSIGSNGLYWGYYQSSGRRLGFYASATDTGNGAQLSTSARDQLQNIRCVKNTSPLSN